MLPIFAIYRSANISKHFVNNIFKPLSIGIKFQVIFPLISTFITIVFLVIFVYKLIKYKKKNKVKINSYSLQ